MKSLNRGNLKYALVFVLGLSIVLNILFYLRLTRQEGKPESNEIVREGMPDPHPLHEPQPPAQREPQQAEPPKPAALKLPALPVAEDASNSPAAQAQKQKNSLRYSYHYFHYGNECDGVKTSGVLDVSIYGLRSQNDTTKIVFEPELPKYISGKLEYNSLSVNGVFEIGKRYKIKVPKGVRIFDNEILEDDYICFVEIQPPSPKVDFATAGPYYQTTAAGGMITDWQMPIKFVNTNSVQVILWGQEERNLDVSEHLITRYWGSDDNAATQLMRRLADKDVPLDGRKNVMECSSLDLAKFFPNLKPGVYGVALNISDGMRDETSFPEFYCKRMVVLSNLGISTVGEQHRGTVAVAVRRLSDSSAVSDADITLVSRKRKILAKAKSGADGTALLVFDNGIYKVGDRAETIIARTSNDISYIRLDDSTLLSTSEFGGSDRTFPNAYYPFIYTERGIYRPGEKAHVSAFVRTRKDDGLCPASLPVKMQVSDSMGTRIFMETIKTNANGFLTFELPLSTAAPTGIYRVTCNVGDNDTGNCSFQVAAFKPDRIKVNAKPEKELIKYDEDFFVDFSSEYYFGGRVEDATYQMSMYAEAKLPRHWREYSVGNNERRRVSLGEFAVTAKIAKAGRMQLPNVKARLRKGDLSILTVPLCVYVQVSASEKGGMTVSNTVNLTAIPQPYMLGLKYNGAQERDAKIEFKYLGLEPGKPAPFEKTDFALKLKKSEWRYVMAKNSDSGNAKMEWTEVLTDVKAPEKIELDKESAIVTLPELEDGNYVLVASSESGLESKLDFWHWSGAAGSVHSTNPNIITATSDKDKYIPGECATLKFFANSDGACFVAAGEEKVEYTVALNVSRGENSVLVPISNDAFSSKYYVSITVTGKAEGNITRAFGLLSLKLDQNVNRLGLKLEAPDKAEPKQRIKMQFKAKEAATAHVFAVDEGILSLTNFKTPDIFNFFHGAYASTFSTRDIYSRLYPKLAIDGPQKVGGGDEDAAAERLPKLKEDESAVVVLGTVEIPESGDATAELELPDHVGAMRIMAVAAGAHKVDSADSSIVIRDKLTVLPSLPTAVAVGDKFLATFKLFNHEIEASDAKLSVILPPELKAEGNIDFKAKIEKGNSVTCQLPLSAQSNGSFTVNCKLELGGSVATGKAYVNVRSIMPFATDAKQTIIKAGESLELPASAGDWQSISTRELKVNSNPASAVVDALDWLNNYPYGCLEQTTSKAFPLLFIDNLIAAGFVDADFRPQANRAVDDAVVAVLSMRRGSRGFVGWIDSTTIWEEPGIYAAHFIFLAKSNVIAESDINAIKNYLEDKVNDAPMTEKAYAFYVLSLKQMTERDHQRLTDRLKNVPSNGFAQFLIGAAHYNANHASEGVPLVKSALDERVWSQATKDLPWMLSSQTVRTALVLSIAMDIIPDHPANTLMAMELASRLRKDRSCWGTTRDNSFASVALAKFAAHHPRGEVHMTVKEGNSPVSEINHDNFTKKLAKDSKVIVKNTGKADIFIRLKTSGIPAKLNNDNDVVKVTKEIVDKDGKPVTKVRHGDLLTVRITMKTPSKLDDAVLLDLIPGGFAIEDGSLATRAQQPDADSNHRPYISRQERLTDRYLMFGTIPTHWDSVVTYRLRAVTPGTYAVPPTRVEDMYAPDKCGTGNCNMTITIEQPTDDK